MRKPCFSLNHVPFHSSLRASQQRLYHTLLKEGMKFMFVIQFSEVLAASGREGDAQPHFEAADLPSRLHFLITILNRV